MLCIEKLSKMLMSSNYLNEPLNKSKPINSYLYINYFLSLGQSLINNLLKLLFVKSTFLDNSLIYPTG